MEFQVGVDIATAVSVIVTAIVFLIAQAGQARKHAREAARQQRTTHMADLISGFTNILVEGDLIVEKVRKAQIGRPVDLSLDEYTGFCIMVERYVRINSQLLFNVWAKKTERAILDQIRNDVITWHVKLVAANENKDLNAVPSFDGLIETLGNRIEQLSSMLRDEVLSNRTK